MALVRMSKPEPGNPYYNRGNGGVSTCILGNTDNYFYKGRLPGLNVLPNCVGFAAGAYNETFNSVVNPNGKPRFYFSLNSNACRFLELARNMSACGYSLKNYILGPEATPTVGGIMVWGPTPGHVAYVYRVIDADHVCTLESNWRRGKPFIRFSDGTDRRTDDMYNTYPRYRHSSGRNNWGIGSSWRYYGCLANPVITNASDIEYGFAPIHGEPYVVSVKEESDNITNTGKIHITINSGGPNKSNITVFFVFDDDVNKYTEKLSENILKSSLPTWVNHKDLLNCEPEKEYTFTVEDSFTYTHIGIIIKQEQKIDDNKILFSQKIIHKLKVPTFIPGAGLSFGGENVAAQAYIYSKTKNEWLKTIPRIWYNNRWNYVGLNNPAAENTKEDVTNG